MAPTILRRSRSSRRWPASARAGRGVVRARREDDVAAPERDVDVVAVRARGLVERGHVDVGQRDELALAGVEVVGEPAAVALRRQADRAGEPVALRLDDDPLLALLHAGDL